MIKQLAIAICFFAIWPSLAHSQDDKYDVTDKRAFFSCLYVTPLPSGGVYYESKEGKKPLELAPRRRSVGQPLFSKESFKLFTKITREGENGEEVFYKLIAQSRVPQNTKRVLFVLSTAPKGADLPLEVIALDDTVAAFPKGEFRFANFTHQAFGVAFNGTKKLIRPREIKDVKSNMSPKGGFMQMVLYDNKGKAIYGKKIFGQPGNRFMVFILPTQDPKKPIEVVNLEQIVTRHID